MVTVNQALIVPLIDRSLTTKLYTGAYKMIKRTVRPTPKKLHLTRATRKIQKALEAVPVEKGNFIVHVLRSQPVMMPVYVQVFN